MGELQTIVPQGSSGTLSQIQAEMTAVARRQSWLWLNTVGIIILLTICIATFAFPGLLSQREWSYAVNLNQAVRGLVGLILLFIVHTVYQKLQIWRLQTQLKEQIASLERLDRVEERSEQAYKMAAFDPLTDLYNRRSGEMRLGEEILRSKRQEIPLTILMLDVNGLKKVNDTFGHPAGDELLRAFAERVKSAIRGSDVAIRLGGDEFLVLLPQCTVEQVRFVLNRLANLKIQYEQKDIPIEFAAGCATYIPGDSAQTLIARADKALYENKRNGNQTVGVADVTVADESRASVMAILSQRELEIFRLLAQGKSNKEVSHELDISIRTVETHRANIFEKLNLHSMTDLIRLAITNKFV